MISLRLLPEESPVADVRYQEAVDRRRAASAAWVRSWTFRRRLAHLGAAFGRSAAGIGAAGIGMAVFAAAAAEADIADAEREVAADIELADLWASVTALDSRPVSR